MRRAGAERHVILEIRPYRRIAVVRDRQVAWTRTRQHSALCGHDCCRLRHRCTDDSTLTDIRVEGAGHQFDRNSTRHNERDVCRRRIPHGPWLAIPQERRSRHNFDQAGRTAGPCAWVLGTDRIRLRHGRIAKHWYILRLSHYTGSQVNIDLSGGDEDVDGVTRSHLFDPLIQLR